MANIESNGHSSNSQVANDADIGSLGVASLVGEGFQLGVIGFDSVNFNKNYAKNSWVYSRGSGRFFAIMKGSSGNPCAVVIATLSATAGGASVGSGILYVVAPPALGLTGSYALPSAAVAAIPVGQQSVVLILPGQYTEAGPIVVPAGSKIQFFALNADGDSSGVVVQSSGAGAVMSVTGPGTVVGIANMGLAHTLPNEDCLASAASAELSLLNSKFSAFGTGKSFTDSATGTDAKIDSCTFRSAFDGATTSLTELSNTSFQGLTSIKSVTKGSGNNFERTVTLSGGSSLSRSAFSHNAAGSLIVFNPSIPGDTLKIRESSFENIVTPGGTTPFIEFLVNSGVVHLRGCYATEGTDPLYTWIASGHTGVFDGFSSQRKVTRYLAQAVNFGMSLNADCVYVQPTALGIIATAPSAITDLGGRRILVKNISDTVGFYVAPNGAETIDENTTSEPIYVPPQSDLEIECDRASSLWRRVQPRTSGDVYVVATDGSAVPNSYPSFAAAKAVIDRDKTFRTFVPVIEVYPGTYTENVTFGYAVQIRGKDANPYAAILEGDLTMTTDTDPASASGLWVKGRMVVNETGSSFWMHHMAIRHTTAGQACLSISGATSGLDFRIHDCFFEHTDKPTEQVTLSGPYVWQVHNNRCVGNDRTSLHMTQSATGSYITDNVFEGGINIEDSIPVLCMNNRIGSSSGIGIYCGGSQQFYPFNYFVPVSNTDVYFSSFGRTAANVGSYRTQTECAGMSTTASYPLAIRGVKGHSIEVYTGDANAKADVPMHLVQGAGPFTLTFPNRVAYPDGAVLYVINDTLANLTLAAGDGTPFKIGTNVLPAGTACIMIVDIVNNAYWIVSNT